MTTPADDAPRGDAFRFPTAKRPEAAEKVPTPERREPDEQTLDEGIEASFPASDPVSVTISPTPSPEAASRGAAPRPARAASWRTPALAMAASSALLGLGLAALLGRRRRQRQALLRLPFLR